MNYKKFNGKQIVVAGGASGIGRELAYTLSDHGAAVTIINRRGNSLNLFQKEVEQSSREIASFVVDLEISQQVANFVRQFTANGKSIDYFFNCVGVVQGGEVLETPVAVSRTLLDTNLQSVINGTHAVYGAMVTQGSGHIVHFASVAGLLPVPFMAAYTMSKYGVVGYSHALRAEAKSYGLKVSVVCPGFVKTPIYEKATYNTVDRSKTIDVLFHKIPIQSPQQAAIRTLKGVLKNRSTIHTWYSLHAVWVFYRLFPTLYLWIAARSARTIRKHFSSAVN